MNERINELRLDAGISRLHDALYLVVINKSGEIIDPIIGLEKFAELIVDECITQIQDHMGRGKRDEYYQGQSDIVKFIRQHFGVKE